jgi:hypothetical protein
MPLHGKVLGRLKARLRLSQQYINDRYDEWNRVDEHVRMYIDLTRKARNADKTSDPTKYEMPFQRAIVVPVSFAILQVRLAMYMQIFLSRPDLIELEGRSPSSVDPAKKMEALLAYDLHQSQSLLTLFQLIQDAEKYSMGVIYDSWEEVYGYSRPPRMQTGNPLLDAAIKLIMGEPKPQWKLQKEYNSWENVDPFNFWPDPRVTKNRLQKGEFCGHRIFRGQMYLEENRKENGGAYFNIEHAHKYAGKATVDESRARLAGSITEYNLREQADQDDKGYYAIDHIQVKLIPKEWELGDGDKPEIWWFTLCEESLIIRAHPSAYEHGEFTYSVAESNYDAHCLFNPGICENLDGIQRFMNWLLNSHIENLMKSINDCVVYSPTMIEEVDLLNPGPAKHIRLTAAGEEMLMNGSMSIDQMYRQFTVTDITTQHLSAFQILFDMAQRMTAANDPMMGAQTKKRQTLGELSNLQKQGNMRIGMTARLIDCMALQPLAYRACANRQQFTTMEQYVRIVGELQKKLGGQERLAIGGNDIQGDFDYIPHTGVIPPDPARNAQVWAQIMQAVGQMGPVLLQPGQDGKMIDLREIFKETAHCLGVKNIESFFIPAPPPQQPGVQTQVMPDHQVQQGVKAGNIVPAGTEGLG